MSTAAQKRAAAKKAGVDKPPMTPDRQAETDAAVDAILGTSPPLGTNNLKKAASKPAASKPATKKKPGRKKKITPPKSPGEAYYSYELTGDKPDVNFTTMKQALEFKQDFGGHIKKEHKFSSLARYNNHVSRRAMANSVATPQKNVRAGYSNENDQNDNAAAEAIAALLVDSRPVDCMEGYFKTTPSSKIMCVVIRMKTQWKSEFWGWKPNSMAYVLNKYSTITPCNNASVQEAFQNLTYGKARDTDASNANTSLVVHYTPPGKKDVILIDVYVAYTFVTIPYEKIASAQEEISWMKDITGTILTEMRRIMSSPIFKSVLERTTHESFFHKLYAPDRKSNLPKFLNSCVTRPDLCIHYTDHVVQDVANSISDRMFESRLEQRKYPDAQLDADFALLSKDIEDEMAADEDQDDDDDDGDDDDDDDAAVAMDETVQKVDCGINLLGSDNDGPESPGMQTGRF